MSPGIPTLPSRTPRSLSEENEPTIPNEPEGSEPTDPTEPEVTEPTIIAQGVVGDTVTWVLYSDGVMYFEGPGNIPDYTLGISSPWYQYRSSITNIKISDVTSIGSMAFMNYTALQQVTLPETLTTVSAGAFHGCTALRDVYYEGTANEWQQVDIQRNVIYNNNPLQNATLHCVTIPDNPYGTVSNAHFVVNGGELALVFDYPEAITGPIDGVSYQVYSSGITLSILSTKTNKLVLSTLNLSASTYGNVAVYTKASGYTNHPSAEFPDLTLWVYEQTNTNQAIALSVDGSAVSISGLTPGMPFEITFYEGDSTSGVSFTGMSDSAGCATIQFPGVADYELLRYTLEETVSRVQENGTQATLIFSTVASRKLYIPDNGPDAVVDSAYLTGTIRWTLYGSGLLDIQGTGEIPDYTDVLSLTDEDTPWDPYNGFITSVNIGEGITKVGMGAFDTHDSIKTITLPDTMTELAAKAFAGCSGIRSIEIPVNVETIGMYAFANCYGLNDVYYSGSAAQWSAINITELGNDPLLAATIHYADEG